MIKDEQGNLVGFDQLYDAYFDTIFKYILHRVANVAEAEDLTAQTFFKALKNLWRYRWTGLPFSSWLYKIATNEVNTYFRKQRNTVPIDEASRSLIEDRRTDQELDSAQRKLAQNKIFLDLNQALRKLKPDEQALVVLRYFEHKTFAEIANILGKRQGTLTMRTHRALGKLKAELQKRGIDHERIRRSFERPVPPGYQSRHVQAGLTP